MFDTVMLSFSMKVKFAKTIASQSKNLQWDNISFDLYVTSHLGYNIYKKKISPNYWRFIVSDDKTSCTFTMYQKDKLHDCARID